MLNLSEPVPPIPSATQEQPGPTPAALAGYGLLGFLYGFRPLVLYSTLFAWLGGLAVAALTYLAIRHQRTRLRVRRAAVAAWQGVARVAPFTVVGVALLSYFSRSRGGRREVDTSMFSSADQQVIRQLSFLGFGVLLVTLLVVMVALLIVRTLLEALAKGTAKDLAREEGATG